MTTFENFQLVKDMITQMGVCSTIIILKTNIR